MDASELPLIDVEQLRVGMYVVLDLGWKNHPFLRSRFLISSEEQLAQLRALGVPKLRWSPARSTTLPPATEPAAAALTDEAPPDDSATPARPEADPTPRGAVPEVMVPVSLDEWDSLSETLMGNEYADLSERHAALLQTLDNDPEAAREEAERLADLVAAAVSECDRPAVRLLTEEAGEAQAGHEVAVVALSLLLGRDAGLDEQDSQQLALAALLHDIGRRARSAPAAGDRREAERHVDHSVELARAMGMGEAVVRAIAEHHEHADGSGYPAGLRGDQLSTPGKLLAITNRYVELVCPEQAAQGLTPHQALQQMYGRERAHFDTSLLARFVRVLGVYPPGSLVELSDGRKALVVASRPGAALTPRVRIITRPDAEELSAAVDIDAGTPFRILRSLGPEELDPAWAQRSRELARAAFFFEASPSPEWRSWGDEERESESSF